MFFQPDIYSSYVANNLGKTIYDVVTELEPNLVVEFGVLFGFSTVCVAQALRDLGKGHLISYDLWDEYPYHHGDRNYVEFNLKKYDLQDFVTLKKANFFDWLKKPDQFDLMHLDISNTGDILLKVFKELKQQLTAGSVVLFEGGTEERDKVAWMTRYQKRPICGVKAAIGYKIANAAFPALSVIDLKGKVKNG